MTLNEFLKDANKIEEITIGCSGKKVYKIRKKSKVFKKVLSSRIRKNTIY